MSLKEILRIPGPTPIPPSVQNVMLKPMIGHRTRHLERLIERIQPKLQHLFNTKNKVYIMTNSGTGSMEAIVSNLTKPNDEVLVCVSGGFGERFLQICKSYHLNVHTIESEWKDPIDEEKLKKTLRKKQNIKAVFFTYCETSTGVLNPIKQLSRIVKNESNALVVVDAVSAIGGVEINVDKWQIDACVTSSQKALMLPAGLSLISLSNKAKKTMYENKHTKFYFDLNKYEEKINEYSTPFTPAVSLIFGLEEALYLLEQEGLNNVYKRHELMRNMTREAFKSLNINLLAKDDFASPTVTSLQFDTNVQAIRNKLNNDFGLVVAGAPKHLKENVLRIGHMGYCFPEDVLQYISIFEIVLFELDLIQKEQLGKGTKAAQSIYLKYKKGEEN